MLLGVTWLDRPDRRPTGGDAWLDLVTGGRCVLCARAGRDLCSRCRRLVPPAPRLRMPDPCPPGLASCWSAGDYAADLRILLLAFKEHGRQRLRVPLGRLLAEAVRAAAPPGRIVLVPVSSTRAAAAERGFDQVRDLSVVAAARLRRQGHRVAVVPVLRASSRRRDQVGLTSAERAQNSGGSFSVVRDPGPVTLMLVDDIVTSGATARSAQAALEDGGRSVTAIVSVAATPRWASARRQSESLSKSSAIDSPRTRRED